MYWAQAQTHFYYTNMQTKQQKNIQNERRETTNEPMWITKVLALWILAISVEIAGATFFLSIGQGEQHIICMKFQCNFRYTIIIDDSPGNSTFTDLLTWVISPYWIQGFKDRECHTLTYCKAPWRECMGRSQGWFEQLDSNPCQIHGICI